MSKNDVKWIGSNDGNFAITNWNEFEKIAINEDSDVPYDLVVVGDNWWLESVEGYDNKFYWSFKTIPVLNKSLPIKKFTGKYATNVRELNVSLSCGVIILKGDKFLLGHCNAKEVEEWDIPKGMIDEGESEIECALRELEEETGLVLEEENLKTIGRFDFNDKKNVFLFYADIDAPLIVDLECTSLFNHYSLGWIPEMDGHAYMSLEEMKDVVPEELYNTLTEVKKELRFD